MYGYDAIYQLLSATQGGNTTESYSYDPVGNRLSSLGVSPYSYNPSNEMVSTPTAMYVYDNNGNLTSKTVSLAKTPSALKTARFLGADVSIRAPSERKGALVATGLSVAAAPGGARYPLRVELGRLISERSAWQPQAARS
jgi:YD repeat-containing protein